MGGNENMVKLQGKICEGIKVQVYFSIGKKTKVWERIMGGTEYGEECRYGLALNENMQGNNRKS